MNRNNVFIKNTLFNYLFRIIGILLGFVTIPITLNYLGDERFGIWQTMLSMISWATFANFGIANGLRNIVTKMIGNDEESKLKHNISSAYFFVSKISIVIFILLLSIIIIIDTQSVFKNTIISSKEIKVAFMIVAINFCVNFVIGICNSIAYGIHKSYYVTIQQTVISLGTLVLIYFFNIVTKPSIINVAVIYSFINTLGNIVLSVIVFNDNKRLRPVFNYNKNKVDKKMYSLGLQFFVVQIAALILASTDNFLVSTLIGSENVTYYSIVNKLFITVNTIYMIILIPLWNSTADAIVKKDYMWISKMIKKLVYLLIPVACVLIFLVVMFDFIVKIWIGRYVEVDKLLIILMAIYIFLLCFNSIFTNIQNGFGKIKLQIIAMVLAAIVNIPCAFIFVEKFQLDMSGIVLANIVSQFIVFLICPLDVLISLKKFVRKDRKNEGCY